MIRDGIPQSGGLVEEVCPCQGQLELDPVGPVHVHRSCFSGVPAKESVIVVGWQLVVEDTVHLGQAQLGHELVDAQSIGLLEKDTGWSFIVRGANNPHTFILKHL